MRFLPGIVLSAALALLLGHGCDRYEVQQPVNNPPTAPANPSPASDSTTVVESLVPILSWEGGDDPDQDAVVFDIAMGTALPLGALATTDERHLDLDLALRLPGDAVVLWQVVARDARGASAAGPLWTFRTGTDGNRPPTALGSPVPADGDTGVATDALLQWFGGEDPEGGTVRYTARIDTLEDFSSPAAQVDSTLGDRRYRPATELLAHTLYYWQVTADDTVGARRTGDVWSFATGSGPTAANEPPDPVGGPIPADGLAGVSVTHPALRWAGGLDPDGDPVVFSVYLGTGGDLQLLGTTTEKRLDLPTHLAFATIHDWRVDAADDHGHVTPGPVWSFSTEVNDPPTPITDPSPVDGATDQPTDVDIAWQGGLDPEDLELEYALYLGTDGQPLELVTMTTQHSVPMGTHGPLAHDTTYRWRVDAIDSEGLVTASDTWSFATVPDGAPSAPCAPVTPASGATGIGASVMLTWSCGIDPEGDPVTYDVLLGTGLPLTDPVASGLTSRSHMLSDLPAHTLHYWQARATDGATPPVAGPIWWFTTANTPPGMVSDPTPVDTAVEVALDEDLGWAAAVDADGDTVTYRVLLDLVSPPVTELGTTALTTIDAGTLEELTTYSWRVVAEDGFGGFSPGPIWRFTTAERPNRAPEAASAPGPPDHASDVGLDVVLTWTGSDPDGDDLIYDVHLGTGDPPPLLFTTINA
ncbi:MAG: hypothetical protein PVF43_00805, partial [Candidatus Eiseniibacteriota bacterium]